MLFSALAKERDDAGCMVALYPAPYQSRQLSVLGGEPHQHLHVTLAYLGKARDVDREDVIRATRYWAEDVPTIRATVGGFGVFTEGPEPVVYLTIDSPDLDEHRHRLISSLRSFNVPPKTEHGFTPHMTLAYGDGVSVPDDEQLGTRLWFPKVTVMHGGRREDLLLQGQYEPSPAAPSS